MIMFTRVVAVLLWLVAALLLIGYLAPLLP